MVHITEDLVRRRAEHNECEIFSLEEVSLHQQDIERIQHLDRWCRDLRILYLQNNLIPRIENVGRLKKLEYLNLALNNIEVIENLEGCESLQKLDLTVNFVGRLSSVASLQLNLQLRELFLVGNPCTEYDGYRQYVVATLPQLKCLDGTEICRSERIRAAQGLEEVKRRVWEQEAEYLRRRGEEKEEALRKAAGHKDTGHKETGHKERTTGVHSRGQGLEENQNQEEKENQNQDQEGKEKENQEEKENQNQDQEENQQENQEEDQNEEEKENQDQEENVEEDPADEEQREKEFWNTPCAFTPESRLEAHRHLEEKRRSKEREEEKKKPKVSRTLIRADGRVMNVNEPKLNFSLTEDEQNNSLVLDLAVYRHMDSSLIDVDVQPTYARVTVKGKIFQMALPADVKPDSSTAQRSQTTGHLVLSMPKAGGEIKVTKSVPRPPRACQDGHSSSSQHNTSRSRLPERLEVDPSKRSTLDLANIVPRRSANQGPLEASRTTPPVATGNGSFSEGFVDDPDVPPLM